MANKHNSLNELLTDIANAIREKTGSNDSISANDFPNQISNITSSDLLFTQLATGEIVDITDDKLDGLATIPAYAFSGCSKLKSVILPNTVTSINSYAFKECANLTSIKVPWSEGTIKYAPWGATNATITYNYEG